jgi:hypothetical protein
MIPSFDQLIQVLKECLDRENQLGKLKSTLRELVASAKNMDEIKKNIPALLEKIFSLEADQAKALNQALEIADALQQNQPPPQPPPADTVKAGDLATQFRVLMDTIQSDARAPREGAVATTLKSLDIELKGLIVVKNNEAQIVPPAPGSTVDPGTLSTIRLSYGTIPILKPTQAAPAPTPAPRPPSKPSDTTGGPAGSVGQPPAPKPPAVPPVTRAPRTRKPK